MNKTGLIAARLLQIVPTFLLIGVVVFVLARLLPGDPVSAMLGDRASDEAVNRLKQQMGFDRSIFEQFVIFLQSAVKGDLGTSIAFRVPVTQVIAERLPVTLALTGLATLSRCARRAARLRRRAVANRWPDYVIRGVFQVGLSSPVFYVGLVLLTVFAAWFRWFPVGGYGEGFLDILWHLILPAMTLALSFSAVIMRNLRASILDVLNAEFVDFARSKGLSRRIVLLRHVLRNALISTVTLVGLHAGSLLGGAVITESVFAVPGVGRLMVDSIFARDYPMIQALTLDPRRHRVAGRSWSPTSSRWRSTRGWRDDRPGAAVRRTPASLIAGGAIIALLLVCALLPGLGRALRPAGVRLHAPCCSRRARRTPSAPTSSAATSSRAPSRPRPSTCRSRSSPPSVRWWSAR